MLPKRARAILTARSTVLGLLVCLVAALGVAAMVPQRGADPGAQAPATDRAVVRLLGLDHVFTSAWFAALAVAFATSLSLSTLDQLRAARARMRQPPGEGAGTPSALPPGEIDRVLRAEGYRRVSEAPGRVRYVRRWQGYWGNALLHAGMTIAVLFAVVYVLTEHRATLRVVSGRPNPFPEESAAVRRGLLARDLPIPAEVDVRSVVPTFGAHDQLVDLASDLVVTDRDGASRELRVAVNAYVRYRGALVYQLLRYGHAFRLELDGGGRGRTALELPMAFPEKRGAPSYENRTLGDGRVLKAKYYASADRSRLVGDDPELVVRLYEGERLLGEATLLAGQEAPLGPYRVRLDAVGWWTEILLEGSLGSTGIFAGFAVLLLGGALVFFAVPREVIVRAAAERVTVQWRTARFSDMLRDEAERVVARCTGSTTS